jgi:hypothetical protein
MSIWTLPVRRWISELAGGGLVTMAFEDGPRPASLSLQGFREKAAIPPTPCEPCSGWNKP